MISQTLIDMAGWIDEYQTEQHEVYDGHSEEINAIKLRMIHLAERMRKAEAAPPYGVNTPSPSRN